MTVRIAPVKDSKNMPAAAAMPSAAASQTEEAVVRPRDCFAFLCMAPAPRKPTEEEMAAATRVGSAVGNAASVVDMKMAAPKLTRLKVRTPASELAARRSMPMIPPTTRATKRRDRMRASMSSDGLGGSTGSARGTLSACGNGDGGGGGGCGGAVVEGDGCGAVTSSCQSGRGRAEKSLSKMTTGWHAECLGRDDDTHVTAGTGGMASMAGSIKIGARPGARANAKAASNTRASRRTRCTRASILATTHARAVRCRVNVPELGRSREANGHANGNGRKAAARCGRAAVTTIALTQEEATKEATEQVAGF